ncbi:MAG: hypothetical protein BWY47_01525 [Bacteroidetes bacterium ADurb.Bin302]|nr:MAG: hypothetical protein BWY47_01525 [Bacteroidetes bacterium ADurb.Bin302]
MKEIELSQVKNFTSFGGKSGRLNWIMKCCLKDGTQKPVKRDNVGTYIVLDRKRNYFPKDSFISKSTLWSEMKESYSFLSQM